MNLVILGLAPRLLHDKTETKIRWLTSETLPQFERKRRREACQGDDKREQSDDYHLEGVLVCPNPLLS